MKLRRLLPVTLLWFVAAQAASPTLPQSDRPLAARFANPPAASRIHKIIHSLPDAPADQDALFDKLTAQGFGGFVSNVSFDGYVENEDRWRAFLRGVREAKIRGMSLWLYDERGYPSGTAGGITMRGHPEWEARGLLVSDGASAGGPVKLDLPPGKLVMAAAFPVEQGNIAPNKRVDLASRVTGTQLAWDAPPGNWRVMAITEDRLFDGTHAALNYANKFAYINLLMPEPTARFIGVTHQQYANRLDQNLGRWFVSTFTDEPSLMSLFLRPMPYKPLPWAPNLAAEFRKRRGYALEPLLPALVADAGSEGSRARYDFWQTVGELVSENYFGQIQQWCQRHQVASGGHLLMEESLAAHVPLYGDFFRCVRRVDAPSIDCLTSDPPHVPWFIARLHSSVAELEGRAVTMCETSDFQQRYRPPGDQRPVQQVTEEQIRGTCNRLLLNGITTITSYYSFAGLADEQLRRLNEWIGRCSTMLAGGHQVADIAVLYPIQSLWAHFTPAKHGATDDATAKQIAHVYHEAERQLYGACRDFIHVDAQALTEACVEDGALVHGKLRWRVVILPCTDTLPLAAWEKLREFWHAGGVVVALGTLPANTEREFPSAAVQAMSREMFGRGEGPRIETNARGGAGVFLPAGSEKMLPSALNRVFEADVKLAGGPAPVRATHRRIAGREVYFIINDSGKPWSGDIALAGNAKAEQWNPATGAVTPLPAAWPIKLNLEPYGGSILTFAGPATPRRLQVERGALK